MAKPHKFAWNGIDVETALSIEQLANMAQRAAQECTGDLMHGKHRIVTVKSTDRQIEFRINDFLITFKKFMVFYLDFERRGDRVWMSSRIAWYVTTQPTVGGFIPVAAKSMVGHHTYMEFVRHVAQQVKMADPQARVTIREGVAGVSSPAAPGPASGNPSSQAATPPAAVPPVAATPLASRPLAAPPVRSAPPPPLGRPVPPPPPPPSATPVPQETPRPQSAPPIAPTPVPHIRPDAPRTTGAGGLVTSVPGMPTSTTDVPTRAADVPAEPEPTVSRYASLAEQMFAEDDDLFHTRLTQAGPDARGWVLTHPNGPQVAVAEAVVLGRNPSPPPTAPGALTVCLNDPNRSVSKTHALIELREGLPWITDLNSTNGTTLTNEVGEAVVCVPGSAVPAGDNWYLDLGEYTLQLSRTAS